MKIFFDVRPIFSPITSGIPQYVRHLTKELIKQKKPDYEYLFFVNSFRSYKSEMPELNGFQKINFGISNRILTLSTFLFSFPKIDKLVKADVFYSFHFDNLSLLNKNSRILTIHDLSFLYFPHFFNLKRNVWHHFQNVEKQIKEAGKIITVSHFSKETILEKFKIKEEKVEVVYPGVSSFFRKINKDDEGLKNFIREKNINYPFILNVSTIEPRKNHLGLIKAFKMLKTKKTFSDLKLIIVGGKGWKYKEIFKYVEKNDLKDDVIFWGEAKNEELLYLYNLASLFVYPSFFEGFGFPPLEAQAIGVPVLSSSRTSLKEVLGDGALFFDPFKIYEIEEALEVGMLNTSLREELIEKGFQNVVKFKWEKTAQNILEIIENFKNA